MMMMERKCIEISCVRSYQASILDPYFDTPKSVDTLSHTTPSQHIQLTKF
jgi:hypothetical protein